MTLFHGITLEFVLVTIVSVFTIVNPLGATLIFLTQAAELPEEKSRTIGRRASLTCFLVLTFFALTGEFVFKLMGVTIPAFQIAGGIMIFTVALDMLKGKHIRSKTLPEEQQELALKEDFSIIPLAIPLLSGPGAITTVIVLMSQARSVANAMVVILAIFVTALSTYIILSHSTKVLRLVGPSGIRVMNRLMGLIIAGVSVQFVINGVHDLLPSLVAAVGTR